MPDSELAVVSPQTFQAPILIERASPSTRKKFFEFFTVPIRNANTRAAYYRAIQQFLAWAERAGYQDLEDIEPITVAAYIEILQRRAAPPTVKQHMAAIRMLFSWLTEKGVLAMNPAREVKTERFSRAEGKTPAFVEGEVQKLLGAVETSTHTGLRDRALLGVLAYTFARIGAAVNLRSKTIILPENGFCSDLKRKAAKKGNFPCTICWKSCSTNTSK
jgi:integrase/recombinase XerC